jgi:hypothetical protein
MRPAGDDKEAVGGRSYDGRRSWIPDEASAPRHCSIDRRKTESHLPIMKRTALLAVLCFTAGALAGPEEKVSDIRGWYETIQKAKPTKERKVPFEADAEPVSGDLVVRDYEGGWKAVTLSLGAEHGGADEHFYFKDGVLFFAHVVTTHWQFAGEKDDGTSAVAETRKEDRYYYDGENCVRQLSRSATFTDEKDPAAQLAKVAQKTVEPGDESKKLRRRAIALRDATTGEAVIRALELE